MGIVQRLAHIIFRDIIIGNIVYRLIVSLVIIHYLSNIMDLQQFVSTTISLLGLLWTVEPFFYMWYIKSELRTQR